MKMSKKSKLIYSGMGMGVAFLTILVMGVVLTADDMKDSVFKIMNEGMSPTIKKDEWVKIDKEFSFKEILLGDIVMFDSPDNPEKRVVNRVVSVASENPLTFKVIADSNINSINVVGYKITEKEYVGKIMKIYAGLETLKNGEGVRYP